VELSTRRPSTSSLLVAGAAVVVALAACGEEPGGEGSATAGVPDLEQSLAAHGWLIDLSDSSIADVGADSVTLAFAGATAASGAAPCNTYRGVVTLDGDDGVRIADIATTLIGCEPPVMAAEREYLEALAEVRTADVTDRDRLVLTSDEVRLSFTAIDAQEFVVGEWVLTAVRNGGAIQSTVVGTEPTARFGADRSLVVETGCNTLRTTWEIDGREMALEQPAGTLMVCEEPAGVMDQEMAIAAALTAASAVEVTPTTLSLLDDAGDMVLVARRA
jgi:heat shock protein HslJ